MPHNDPLWRCTDTRLAGAVVCVSGHVAPYTAVALCCALCGEASYVVTIDFLFDDFGAPRLISRAPCTQEITVHDNISV